ncbi:MAG: hypothetical protein ACOYOS_00105 [Syntrophales bacterium]
MYTKSEAVAGSRPAVYPAEAGKVIVADGRLEVTADQIAHDNLIGLVALPAGCIPLDFTLIVDDLDTGTALTLSCGLVNAGETDLETDMDMITDANLGQAGGSLRATALPVVIPTQAERIVAVKVTAGGIAAVWASATVTSSGVNVTADDTVTINAKAYKFVAAPADEGDVDIGATAAETLSNLLDAINHAGDVGTAYVCAAAHPTVMGKTVTDTVLTLEALAAGAGGNSLTLAKSAVTLTVSHDHLLGGVTAVPLQGGTIRGILTYRAEEYGE